MAIRLGVNPRGGGRNDSGRPTVRTPTHNPTQWLDGALLQLPTFSFRQASPDAEALVMCQRVLEALVLYLACQADLLGLPGGTALLREERLRIGLRAQSTLLPAHLLGVAEQQVDIRPLLHGSPPSTSMTEP